MNTDTKTECVSPSRCHSQRPAARKVWQLVISPLLGIGASVVLLGLFDYSVLGFFTVGAFWLMAAIGTYRRFKKSDDDKVDA